MGKFMQKIANTKSKLFIKLFMKAFNIDLSTA